MKIKNNIVIIIASIIVLGVLIIDFIPNMYFIKLKEHHINLGIVITNILGNIIVFAPYGILVPIIFKEKFIKFVIK